jgi:hypothetical protein
MNIPKWVKPGLYGVVAGAVALAIVGFAWGGWVTGGDARQRAEAASQAAIVSALAPICADKFERAANTDASLITKLNAVDAWERDGYLTKAGWVTFPGNAKPDSDVAKACLNLLKKSLKLK